MSGQDARDVIAAHHAEYDDYFLVCRCGERWPALREDYDAEIALHAAHQLDALTDAGYEIVKLPEPDLVWNDGFVRWSQLNAEHNVAADGGRVRTVTMSAPMSLSEARDHAAAILAAAAHAEAGEDRG